MVIFEKTNIFGTVMKAGLCVLFAVFLAACGGGGGGGGDGGSTQTAPTELSYGSNPAVYSVGTAISANTPSSSGGAVNAYSVNPALPAGLTLNTGTGVISGTPNAITALTSYTVTASNSVGSTTATLSIATESAGSTLAPSGLSYSSNPVIYQVSVQVGASNANTPTSSGGVVTAYSVNPALPAGLRLDTVSGQITGFPTEITAAANYTVTAINSAGTTTVSLSLEVNVTGTRVDPPTALSNPSSNPVYMQGIAIIDNRPSISGGDVGEYSVSPELPTGLFLNSTTGVISGTPAVSAATANYTVTASNSAGSTSVSLSIEVNPPVAIATSPVGPLDTTRREASVTLLRNGKVLIAGGLRPTGCGFIGNLPVTLSSAELYDPATGDLTTVGSSMNTSRNLHTATLLPNGKVLIAGGVNNSTGCQSPLALESAELYDPVTETFTATGSLSTPRGSHTATLLPNGKVLIAGGATGCYQNAGTSFCSSNERLTGAELYDPATGTFSATGSLSSTRWDSDAALLPNGKVLFAGGKGIDDNGDYFNLSSAELYDPATGNSSLTASLSTATFGTRITLLPNGKVLIAHSSGADLYDPATDSFVPTVTPGSQVNGSATLLPDGTVLIASTNVQLYDPLTNSFSLLGTLDTSSGKLTVLPNGKVLVVSESGAAVYDPGPGSTGFSAAGSMAARRTLATATLLPTNGRVLIAGGRDASTTLSSAELYDPVLAGFSATGSMALPRRLATATLLPTNGKVLIAGGLSAGRAQSSAELYDPATGGFSSTGSLVGPRLRAGAILLPTNGKVLIVGGDSDGVTLSSAELFDPLTESFSATGSLLAARYSATVTLLANGKVLVAGGTSTGIDLSSVELYDPATGGFSATGSLLTGRTFATATRLPNGKVLIAGGFDTSTGALSSAELYDTATGSFSAAGSLATARYDATATLLPNGKVLIAGGRGISDDLNSAELFDPATNSFSATAALATARREATATLLPTTGEVLISGGIGNVYLFSAELYQ